MLLLEIDEDRFREIYLESVKQVEPIVEMVTNQQATTIPIVSRDQLWEIFEAWMFLHNVQFSEDLERLLDGFALYLAERGGTPLAIMQMGIQLGIVMGERVTAMKAASE